MATNDLMTELQKDSIKLDDESERKVTKAEGEALLGSILAFFAVLRIQDVNQDRIFLSWIRIRNTELTMSLNLSIFNPINCYLALRSMAPVSIVVSGQVSNPDSESGIQYLPYSEGAKMTHNRKKSRNFLF
jgi:hypothetical protein